MVVETEFLWSAMESTPMGGLSESRFYGRFYGNRLSTLRSGMLSTLRSGICACGQKTSTRISVESVPHEAKTISRSDRYGMRNVTSVKRVGEA